MRRWRGWKWVGRVFLAATVVFLVYLFFPRVIRLELLETRYSEVAARQDRPSWKMAYDAGEEAFDDYGIPVPAQVDFRRVNVVISHGRPLRFITYIPFSRLTSRYLYFIDLYLGHPWYIGSFERGKVYVYRTKDKRYVYWGNENNAPADL